MIFHQNFDSFVEIWIMANKKETQKRSLGNTMKNYPDKSFEYVIPNTKALKN